MAEAEFGSQRRVELINKIAAGAGGEIDQPLWPFLWLADIPQLEKISKQLDLITYLAGLAKRLEDSQLLARCKLVHADVCAQLLTFLVSYCLYRDPENSRTYTLPDTLPCASDVKAFRDGSTGRSAWLTNLKRDGYAAYSFRKSGRPG